MSAGARQRAGRSTDLPAARVARQKATHPPQRLRLPIGPSVRSHGGPYSVGSEWRRICRRVLYNGGQHCRRRSCESVDLCRGPTNSEIVLTNYEMARRLWTSLGRYQPMPPRGSPVPPRLALSEFFVARVNVKFSVSQSAIRPIRSLHLRFKTAILCVEMDRPLTRSLTRGFGRNSCTRP